MEIGLPVLEKKFLKGFYHIWASWPSWLCDQHHVIRFSFPCTESFKQNLGQIGTEVSEKIQFEFLYLHTLGKGQEITLTFNTHISSIYSIRCHFFPIEKPNLPNLTLP